jgi:DNA-binding CsgD family transcriptional regulator
MSRGDRELARAVGAAAASTSLRDLGTALPHLRTALGASSVLLYHYPEPEQLTPIAGDLMPVIDRYTLELYRQDAVHRTARRIRPRPRIVRDHELVARDQHLAGAPYNEFYRQYEIDHFACTWLTPAAYAQAGMVGLMIARGPKQGDFSTTELARLELALPVFAGAAERGLRVALDRCVLESVLDAASIRPCFALDGRGRVVWASSKAEQLIGSVLARRAVPVELVAAAQRLLAADRAATVAVRVAFEGRSLRAELCVVDHAYGLVVVAFDAVETERVATTAIAARFGLTLAETDVLGWLVHGLTNREIATRLFVSTETVRTHVKRIFDKLGVATRTEAAMLVRR